MATTPAKTPGKNIVLLSDGTGNSAAKVRRTNVWRMYEAVDLRSGDQVALYDNGVGTSSFKPFAILGGALGWGLKRNVRDLYTFACRNYVPGSDSRDPDRIYVFGFSRGAFTARVLIALIEDQGLIRDAQGAELDRLAKWAYRAYRRKFNVRFKLLTPLRGLRDWLLGTWEGLLGLPAYRESKVKPQVEFVGLWDTVSAYGLPIDEMTRGWDQWVWPLSMVRPNPPDNVVKICHALAMDDERQTFHPLLLDELGEERQSHTDDERLTQVWFVGAHSDVGGGYPDDGLAHVSMLWMAGEARKRGLRLHDSKVADWEAHADPNGPGHDSRRGLGSYYRYQPRSLRRLGRNRFAKINVPRPKVHESVFARIRSARQEYAPIVLSDNYVVVKGDGSIIAAEDNPFEHATQSAARYIRQEAAWNLVWQRRLVYFATVLVTLLIAIPSLIGDRYAAIDQRSLALSGVIHWMTQWLPDAAHPIAEYYEHHPVVLTLLVLVLTTLVWRSMNLQRRIRDRMRKTWDGVIVNGPEEVEKADPPTDLIYRLRTHQWYRAVFEFATQRVFPFAFGVASLLAVILVVIGTTNRAVFAIASAGGAVCKGGTSAVAVAPDTWTATLDNRQLCGGTGITLGQGNRYEIRVELAAAWRDGPDLETRLAGFSSTARSGLFVPALPFRRVLMARWFVPVARVGETGAEYHLFSPVDRAEQEGAEQQQRFDQAVADFSPKHTGELFLFVNDAIAPWGWDVFYQNNEGGPATVTVRKLAGTEK